MIKHIKQSFILICCFTLSACVTDMTVRDQFDKETKNYNRMIRWHELENAVFIYMEAERRENFLNDVAALKKKGVTITDFRILATEYLQEKEIGHLITEFEYYIMPSNKIKTLIDKQEWVYRENKWKLKSNLPKFE